MLKVWIYICAVFSVGVVLCLPTPDEEKGIGQPDICEDFGVKIEKDKTVVSIPGQCMKATCVEPEINQIVYTICPKLDFPPECHLPKADHSKPFPDCCPKPVCKKNDA